VLGFASVPWPQSIGHGTLTVDSMAVSRRQGVPRENQWGPAVAPGKEGTGGAHRGRQSMARWCRRWHSMAARELQGLAVMKAWPCSLEEEGNGEAAPWIGVSGVRVSSRCGGGGMPMVLVWVQWGAAAWMGGGERRGCGSRGRERKRTMEKKRGRGRGGRNLLKWRWGEAGEAWGRDDVWRQEKQWDGVPLEWWETVRAARHGPNRGGTVVSNAWAPASSRRERERRGAGACGLARKKRNGLSPDELDFFNLFN
jgi:hypothetical protein